MKDNEDQAAAAAPGTAPEDTDEFPDKEPVISKDMADYIKKHDDALENSCHKFEWTEASFFGHDGDNETQHDIFRGKNAGAIPVNSLVEKDFFWDDSVPATSAPRTNDTFVSATEVVVTDGDSPAEATSTPPPFPPVLEASMRKQCPFRQHLIRLAYVGCHGRK